MRVFINLELAGAFSIKVKLKVQFILNSILKWFIRKLEIYLQKIHLKKKALSKWIKGAVSKWIKGFS